MQDINKYKWLEDYLFIGMDKIKEINLCDDGGIWIRTEGDWVYSFNEQDLNELFGEYKHSEFSKEFNGLLNER